MHFVIPALFAAMFVPFQAAAQTRPQTMRLTCDEAAAVVKRQGDVVLTTGPGLTERIVRDRSFCGMFEIAELRFAVTRDNPQCPIGYRCKEPDYDGWDWGK